MQKILYLLIIATVAVSVTAQKAIIKIDIERSIGEKLEESFSYDKKDSYVPVPKQIKTGKNSLSYSFPPHSFTQIKIPMKK